MNPDLELELYKKSGQSYALNAIPRILWVKNNMPDIYEKTAKIGMFNDWLIYKLTGVLAVEPSNGSTTGLLDLQTRTWDTEIAAKCNLRTDISRISRIRVPFQESDCKETLKQDRAVVRPAVSRC